jgi:hypothetical protein
MVKAFVDPKVYKERNKAGEVIEVVHVYYGCTQDECATTVRLRFRRDGLPGDLWNEIKARRAAGTSLRDFGGRFGDIE